MNDPLTVLVLGVGGNVSQGILKALALSDLRPRVIGACVSHLSTGLYTVDRAYVSPPASDPTFLEWLIEVCERDGVGAILSGVEPVLAALSQKAELIRDRTGAVSLVSSPDRLEVGQDKLLTARWLAERGFNAPRTADLSDRASVEAVVAECGYPLVAKPRHGKGGQGIFAVEGPVDLEYVRQRPGYVLQEQLGDADGEYTVACFADREGRLRGTLAMKRELLDGTTLRATVVDEASVRDEAARIVSALEPLGPANVQLRLSHGRPVCFEINVRFSGTAPIRARLGFNDVEAALRHFVLGEQPHDLPLVTEGVALRYWNEIYIDPAARDELERSGRLADPLSHPLAVEDYGRPA